MKDKIEILKQKINEADAIVVGSSAMKRRILISFRKHS